MDHPAGFLDLSHARGFGYAHSFGGARGLGCGLCFTLTASSGLTLGTPARGGFAADQDTLANAERVRHVVLELVEKLDADAVPSAELLDGEGVGVVRHECIGIDGHG